MSPGVIEFIQGGGGGGKQDLAFRSNKLLSLKHSFGIELQDIIEPKVIM